MKGKITNERVGPHSAFFHPRQTGRIVLDRYRKLVTGPQTKVLVTGVFDILHLEHKKLLLAAKKLGQTLLVGVESNERVRQLKGPGRPVNGLKTRIKNLQKLGIADKVFGLPKKFNTDEEITNFVKKIRPNILAVSTSTPYMESKRRIMARAGGKVMVVLPHNPNISTTKLLESGRHGK
jgi:D-beta-D-heptose 7-phosphate kinase/D-beta-D-heptose 1-phosphate adenosyltransferase